MTSAQLHLLYLRAYDEYDPLTGPAQASSGLSALARAVAEFAAFDAQNGIAPRTRDAFEACLAQGAGALKPLGLRAA
ncbi:MAG: hypothetical protein QM767_23035 [Anaeromyxobacter sp.]